MYMFNFSINQLLTEENLQMGFKYFYRIKFTSCFFKGLFVEMNLNIDLEEKRQYEPGKLFKTSGFVVTEKFVQK